MKSGAKNKYAVNLGRRGGLSRSAAKVLAAQSNGKKGGRPPGPPTISWIKFFDSVDDVRRSREFAPLKKLFQGSRVLAVRTLITATVRHLARELNLNPPLWAQKITVLNDPYFVSGVENLKAMALMESPVDFKMSNIYVLDNFLNRV